jgi:hypothetical protein
MVRPRDERFQTKFSNWLFSQRNHGLGEPFCCTDIDIYYENLETGHYWLADEKGDGRPPKRHQFAVYELIDRVHSRSHLYLGFFLFTMKLGDEASMYVNYEPIKKVEMKLFCGPEFDWRIVERYRRTTHDLRQSAYGAHVSRRVNNSIERWTNECCIFKTKLEHWLCKQCERTALIPARDCSAVPSQLVTNAGYVWWNKETYDFLLIYAQCTAHPLSEDLASALLHYFDMWSWPYLQLEHWKFRGVYIIRAKATDPEDCCMMINYEPATPDELKMLLEFRPQAIEKFHRSTGWLYNAHKRFLAVCPSVYSQLKLVRASTVGAQIELLRVE